MPFIGAINDKLRKFFSTHVVEKLEGKQIYVGCSGNFTVEQLISRKCKDVEIFSNDVSLYSSLIGYTLTDRQLKMEVVKDEIRWVQKYLDQGGAVAIGSLLLLMELFKYEKRNNACQERMWQAYLVQWEAMLGKTREKIEKALENTNISDYTMIDVFDYFPKPGVAIGFLPTYVGGYEKLFAKLEEYINWESATGERPRYELLTTERREASVQKMQEGEYILYDDQERDLPCVARVDLFGHKTVFIYSNLEFNKGVFRKKINEKVPNYEILMPEDEIPRKASIKMTEVDLSTLNHYRNMYLSKSIQPGSGGPCYLLFVDDKVFGFLIFQAYSKKGGPSDEIYLLSDFVVPSKRYKRLAKLLLMCVKCKEVEAALSEKVIRYYKSVMTTAFTKKPVSMKYRGVFELAKRGKGFLNYRGDFGETTFKEVLKLWMKKYVKQ